MICPILLIFELLKIGSGQLIGGLQNNTIYYYNSSTGVSSLFSSGHTGQVNCLKLLDNATYASGSNDKSVIIWNANTGAQIKTLTGHSDYVYCLELLGNGFLASGGKDNNIYIWNYTSSSTTYSVALTNANGNGQPVRCIRQLSGYYFASGTNSASSNLKIWDYRTYSTVGFLSGHTTNVLSLEMLSAGYLLSVSLDQNLIVWNFTNLSQVAKVTPYSYKISCVREVKPNIIAFGDQYASNIHYIYFWNITNITAPSLVMKVSYTAGSSVTCTDLKLYGENLVAVNGQQTVDVWALDTYVHSTIGIGLPAAGNVLCIETLNDTINLSTTTITSTTTTTPTSSTTSIATISSTTSTTTMSSTTITTSTTTITETSRSTTSVNNGITSASTSTINIITTTDSSTIDSSTITASTSESTIITTTTKTTTTTLSASNTTINSELLTQEFSMSSLTTGEVVSILNSDYDFSSCIVNCSNNGVCKYAGNKTFSCQCNSNYAGQTCQKNILPCSYSPCLNNGTCIDNSTSSSSLTNLTYTCECDAFYYGTNCEYKVNVCANETCSGNGNCADENDVATCTCFSLYSGTHCEIESSQRKTIQAISSTTTVIAIITLAVLYALFILSDLLDCLCLSKDKFKPTRIRVKKSKKYVYVP